MKALLDPFGAGTDEKKNLLSLVSAILAGYCTRSCYEFYRVEHIRPIERRVPVIRVSRFDYTFFVLEKIVRFLAIDTTVFGPEEYTFNKTPLKAAYQPVLPHKPADRSIQDGAYLKIPTAIQQNNKD